jgi:hypothetical protein
VDESRVFPDSKTIVDMPLKAPPAEVAAAFAQLKLPDDPEQRNQTLADFVEKARPAASCRPRLHTCPPPPVLTCLCCKLDLLAALIEPPASPPAPLSACCPPSLQWLTPPGSDLTETDMDFTAQPQPNWFQACTLLRRKAPQQAWIPCQ